MLTMDELLVLQQHFGFSLDAFTAIGENVIISELPTLTNKIQSYREYANSILMDFKKIASIPGVKIFYCTSEIPFFHYLAFPELIALKLAFWCHTTWEFKKIDRIDQEIEAIVQDKELMDVCRELLQLYDNTASTEIWAVHFFEHTVSQLYYYIESGKLKNVETIQVTMEKLYLLIQHYETVLQAGSKKGVNGPVPVQIYLNEICHTNNTILVTSPIGGSVHLTHANPNFLKTTQQGFINYTEHWMQQLIQKSDLISGQSEKRRLAFLEKLKRKLEHLEKQVKEDLYDIK